MYIICEASVVNKCTKLSCVTSCVNGEHKISILRDTAERIFVLTYSLCKQPGQLQVLVNTRLEIMIVLPPH
jgi:hypothetical protein